MGEHVAPSPSPKAIQCVSQLEQETPHVHLDERGGERSAPPSSAKPRVGITRPYVPPPCPALVAHPVLCDRNPVASPHLTSIMSPARAGGGIEPSADKARVTNSGSACFAGLHHPPRCARHELRPSPCTPKSYNIYDPFSPSRQLVSQAWNRRPA